MVPAMAPVRKMKFISSIRCRNFQRILKRIADLQVNIVYLFNAIASIKYTFND